jgi:hypothetical protein
LILVCAAMLEVAAQSVRFFPTDFARQDRSASSGQDRHRHPGERAIGGSIWSGITHIFRSSFLFGLFVFILLYTTTSPWAYFQQSDLTRYQIHDRAVRTAFLAKPDLSVNSLTLLGQIFLTGRLLKWLGVGATLVLTPALSMIGLSRLVSCRYSRFSHSFKFCGAPQRSRLHAPLARCSSPFCPAKTNPKRKVSSTSASRSRKRRRAKATRFFSIPLQSPPLASGKEKKDNPFCQRERGL